MIVCDDGNGDFHSNTEKYIGHCRAKDDSMDEQILFQKMAREEMFRKGQRERESEKVRDRTKRQTLILI